MTLHLTFWEIETTIAALEYHMKDVDILSHVAWQEGDKVKAESLTLKANDIDEVRRRLRNELRRCL